MITPSGSASYDWTAGEIAVVGLGKSGSAACALLRRRGARVYASDVSSSDATQASAESAREAGAEVETGRHDVARVARAHVVVVSPGVPPDAPPLVAARNAGTTVVSEIELALDSLPGLRYVAVTGTNGKSTVTALTAHLLRGLGIVAEAAGNIGTPLSALALRDERPEWVALEVSSFQLHDTPSMRPTVGVLTNLAPDHLDRYPNVESYYADKARLFRHAGRSSRWVLNTDDDEVAAMTRDVPGLSYRFSSSGRLCDAFLGGKGKQQLIARDEPLLNRSELPLLGDHNVGNALAASLAVMASDPAHESLHDRGRIADGLRSFRALPHRLEPVAEVDGVLWIDDSKATNVASAKVAVASMTRPTVLLLGGRHKGEPYSSLVAPVAAHCRAVVAYGESAGIVERDLDGDVPVERVDGGFDDVLARARSLARPGDAILLSPACSSYDMFSNYEERGRAFADGARAGRR